MKITPDVLQQLYEKYKLNFLGEYKPQIAFDQAFQAIEDRLKFLLGKPCYRESH